MTIFTELDVLCVCVCLCVPSRKTRFPVDWRLLFEELITNICISLESFGFCHFNDFWHLIFFRVLGSLRTSLLCIIGELAGGGSVVIVTGDR